jgi:hypothetical protein
LRKIDRKGETKLNKEGYEMTIIRYGHCDDIDIQFNNGVILTNRQYTSFKKGNILNPYHPTLCNIGYLGIGVYKVWENNKLTKEYVKWSSLINRCYNSKIQNRQSSYIGCYVVEEWHNFQNFGEWYKENWKPWMDKTWQLDKDILIKGNKVYSPETCCFVPKYINTIFSNRKKERGEYPIGVQKVNNSFIVSVGKRNNQKHKGCYKNFEEAFQVYKKEKENHIREVADEWKEKLDPRVYNALYNHIIEITD